MRGPTKSNALFLPVDSPLNDIVDVIEGGLPRANVSDKDFIFVLNPPPLETATVADLVPEAGRPRRRNVILVSSGEQDAVADDSPLRAFFAMKADRLKAILDDLDDADARIWFMSFRRRRWLHRLLPRRDADARIAASDKYTYFFDGYSPYKGSFAFDDAYRRSVLHEVSLAQSTGYYLRLLADLPGTPMSQSEKRDLFARVFPTSFPGPAQRDSLFQCKGEPGRVREAVVDATHPQDAGDRALAIACLSEIAACFTHIGKGEDYLKMMGDLVRIENDRAVVGRFSRDEKAHLREHHPLVYLHAFYRTPNQFMIARFDQLEEAVAPDHLIAVARDLLVDLQDREQHLDFAKRSHEICAMAGTLCQLEAFAGRFRMDRRQLRRTIEEWGPIAIDHARPHEVARDRNYWIAAVLADYVLFADAAAKDLDEGTYDEMVAFLCDHFDERGDPYNLMMFLLAAAVESALLEGKVFIRYLIREGEIHPRELAHMMEQRSFEDIGSYAVCLAAGYAALIADEMRWSEEDIVPLLDWSDEFFTHYRSGKKQSRIVNLVGLKFAACRLYYDSRHRPEKLGGEARESLGLIEELSPLLDPVPELAEFFGIFQDFRNIAQEPARNVDLRAVLKAVFRLPY